MPIPQSVVYFNRPTASGDDDLLSVVTFEEECSCAFCESTREAKRHPHHKPVLQPINESVVAGDTNDSGLPSLPQRRGSLCMDHHHEQQQQQYHLQTTTAKSQSTMALPQSEFEAGQDNDDDDDFSTTASDASSYCLQLQEEEREEDIHTGVNRSSWPGPEMLERNLSSSSELVPPKFPTRRKSISWQYSDEDIDIAIDQDKVKEGILLAKNLSFKKLALVPRLLPVDLSPQRYPSPCPSAA